VNRVTFVSYFLQICPDYFLEVKMDENLTERKNEIERTIRILEWDKNLKQINPAKNIQLEKFRTELDGIKAKLNPENVKENEKL
jgi:hypothetical protein